MTYKNEKGFADGGCKALTDAGAGKYIIDPQDRQISADKQELTVKNIDKKAEQRAGYFMQTDQFLKSKKIFFNSIFKKYYTGLGTENIIEIEDKRQNSLYTEAVKMGINISQSDFTAIFRAGENSPYIDPVAHFLNGLTYDSKDYIRELAKTVKLANPEDAEYFYQMLKKWLVGCVAGVLDKEQVNGLALFFLGRQGLGKSTWFNNLLPKSMYQYFATIDLEANKDGTQHLLGNWIICFDELGGFLKKDYIFIKKIITQKVFDVRIPFDRNPSKFKRQSSFCGGGNMDKLLSDMTGNRRFLIFDVVGLDYESIKNTEQLWGQCVSLYKSGFRYWLDNNEIDKLNLRNDAFMLENIEQDKIEDKYKIPDTEGFYKYMKTSELAEDLSLPTSKSSLNNIGTILKKLGYVKKSHRRNGCNPQDLWVVQLK